MKIAFRSLFQVAIIAFLLLTISPCVFSANPEWITDPKSGIKAWDFYPHPDESIKYEGDSKNGIAHGKGSLTWYNKGERSVTYVGDFKEGKYHGLGSETWYHSKNGEIWFNYTGGFKEHERHGLGSETLYENGNKSSFKKVNYRDGVPTVLKPLPTGFHIIKLGMTFGDVKNALKQNGFPPIEERGRGRETLVSIRSEDINQYKYIDKLEYKFNLEARGTKYNEGPVKPYFNENLGYYAKRWCLFPNRSFHTFNVDDRGLSFLPSRHLLPNSECKYPLNYVGWRANFPVLNNNELISFEVIITIKEDYKTNFGETFIDKFSTKYGSPDAVVYSGNGCLVNTGSNMSRSAPVAWYDDSAFVAISFSSRHEKTHYINIFYKIINQDQLLSKLAHLQSRGNQLSTECEKARKEKINKSITLE